jgi:hypothetical protein
MNEGEQREFFIKYRKKRDEDINAYLSSKIKQPKQIKLNEKIIASVTLTDAEKLLLKKLGISLSEFKKLKGE